MMDPDVLGKVLLLLAVAVYREYCIRALQRTIVITLNSFRICRQSTI